jgi:hypothetical protein
VIAGTIVSSPMVVTTGGLPLAAALAMFAPPYVATAG